MCQRGTLRRCAAARLRENRLANGKRVNVNLDLFNAFNASPVLGINQTFVPNGAWLVPDGGPGVLS